MKARLRLEDAISPGIFRSRTVSIRRPEKLNALIASLNAHLFAGHKPGTIQFFHASSTRRPSGRFTSRVVVSFMPLGHAFTLFDIKRPRVRTVEVYSKADLRPIERTFGPFRLVGYLEE